MLTGWGNVTACDAVGGGGSEREPAPLSAGFQSLPPLPTSKVGPSGADSPLGGLVHVLGPCGSLQPVRLGVSSAAASAPTGFYSQRFEALFPRAGTLGCAVFFAPQLLLPVYPHVNVGTPAPPAATSPCPPATVLL